MKLQSVFLLLSFISQIAGAPTDNGIGSDNAQENYLKCIEKYGSCNQEYKSVYKRLTPIVTHLPPFDPFVSSGVHNCPPHRSCMSSFGVGVAQSIVGKVQLTSAKDLEYFSSVIQKWDSISNLMKPYVQNGLKTAIRYAIQFLNSEHCTYLII